MSDRLILSAPKSDGDADKIAQRNAWEDSKKRTAQLERNIADLQAVLQAQLALAAAAKAGTGAKIGARKHAKFKAVSTAPSINKTPAGCAMVPVAYPLVQDLSNSVGVASNVWFNDCQAYTLDSSKQPKCTGDEPGTGGGIRSGTVSGEVKPTDASATVWAKGKRVVRDGDACTMNKGNTPGVYVTAPPTSSAPPADAIKTSNPPYPAAAREHAATSDGTNTSPTGAPPATGSWLQPNPFAGPAPRTPAEKLDTMLMKERLSGAGPSHGVPTVLDKSKLGPRFESYDPAPEQQARLRTTNNLSMALLGPFGAPGAAARLSGADEQQVAAANEVGAAAMGVVWSATGIPARQSIVGVPKVISKTSNTSPSSAGGVQIEKSESNGISPPNNVKQNIAASRAARQSSNFEQLSRYEMAYNYYSSAGFSAKRALGHLDGIDFTRPVSVVELTPEKIYAQHVLGGKVGNYFTAPGTPAETIGINPAGRVTMEFTPNRPVSALQSTAADIIDTWTVPNASYPTKGGGLQLYVPEKNLMLEVKKP